MSNQKKSFNNQSKEVKSVESEVVEVVEESTESESEAQETVEESEESTEVVTESLEDVTIHNSSARPITLIGSRGENGKVTILPTETVQVKAEFWALIEKNIAAQTYFKSGELRKV